MHKSTVLALLALGAAGAALAQEQGRVLSSTPIIQQVPLTRQICNAETVYSGSSNSGAGAILGAIAGGAIGNSIGGGSGRAAATAVGVIGGAVAGNAISHAAHGTSTHAFSSCDNARRYSRLLRCSYSSARCLSIATDSLTGDDVAENPCGDSRPRR